MVLNIIGKMGEKFYIILNGCVRVLIPNYSIKDVLELIDQSRSTIDSLTLDLKNIQA